MDIAVVLMLDWFPQVDAWCHPVPFIFQHDVDGLTSRTRNPTPASRRLGCRAVSPFPAGRGGSVSLRRRPICVGGSAPPRAGMDIPAVVGWVASMRAAAFSAMLMS